MKIAKKKHAGRDGKGTVASMLRWLLRRVLRRALGTEEELKLFLAQHWTEWEMLPDIKQLGGSAADLEKRAQAMCAGEARLKPKVKQYLEKVATETANVALDLIHDASILHEEMKYVLGTFLLIMHGYGGNELAAVEFEETAAWYKAIALCGGPGKE